MATSAPNGTGLSAAIERSAAVDFPGGAGLPFAVVDKRAAQLAVYGADGRLVGWTAALTGAAPGDRRYPGAFRKLVTGTLPADERTTPAGRYVSIPGRNHQGDRVVWLDYDNALAIHRLRPSAPVERRPQRLASPTPDDNRITLGCVVVDPVFFDTVVLPVLGTGRAIVQVLPEGASELSASAAP